MSDGCIACSLSHLGGLEGVIHEGEAAGGGVAAIAVEQRRLKLPQRVQRSKCLETKHKIDH